MPPQVKPPTQAEIEEAIKSHSAANPGNSEIGAALKEFEKQQGNVIKPQVSDSVDVMSSQKLEIPEDISTPKMVKKLIKWSGGAIKDQRQAEYVLLGVVIVFISISIYLFFGVSSGSNEAPPSFIRMQQQLKGVSGGAN